MRASTWEDYKERILRVLLYIQENLDNELSLRELANVRQFKKAQYLPVSGRGAPGGETFQIKVGALYGVAYTMKMTRKFEGREDYEAEGCALHGRHHEIYLSDPRRVARRR